METDDASLDGNFTDFTIWATFPNDIIVESHVYVGFETAIIYAPENITLPEVTAQNETTEEVVEE